MAATIVAMVAMVAVTSIHKYQQKSKGVALLSAGTAAQAYITHRLSEDPDPSGYNFGSEGARATDFANFTSSTVASVSVKAGIIYIKGNVDGLGLNPATLYLVPNACASDRSKPPSLPITWHCQTDLAGLDSDYVPDNCKMPFNGSLTCCNGATWNNAALACIGNTTNCAGNQYLKAGQCIACPSGTYNVANNINTSCVTCVASATWDGKICNCPAGTTGNGAICTCPTGKVWNGKDCVSCPDGTLPDESATSCKLCTAGTACSCPGGQIANGFPNGGCLCPPINNGKNLINYYNGTTCVTGCPANYFYQPARNFSNLKAVNNTPEECFACGAEGTNPHNNKNTSCNCPGDATWNTVSGCKCSLKGQIVNPATNTCECPGGQIVKGPYNEGCACLNTQFWNGSNCINCPNDMTSDGVNCICPAGLMWNTTNYSCHMAAVAPAFILKFIDEIYV